MPCYATNHDHAIVLLRLVVVVPLSSLVVCSCLGGHPWLLVALAHLSGARRRG
jgi:hypothetical protein